jgi:pyruvate/2-oxoglutarate dehydrogenase complex dihydrolipoamide acyltransferase (E2) component
MMYYRFYSSLAGITEVQIIQWYVEEGAHIEEWKPLCQYQSDKAVDDVWLAPPPIICF